MIMQIVRSTCTMVCKWNYQLLDPTAVSAPRSSEAVEEQHETQQPSEGYQDDFLAMIGLSEFTSTAPMHTKISSAVRAPGTRIGNLSVFVAVDLVFHVQTNAPALACHITESGLSERAAAELGLVPGTVVAVGIIDAHAGGIGALACRISDDMGPEVQSDTMLLQAFERRMAIIAGTSTCHMVTHSTPLFVPGVWGPYKDAMVPSMYLNEGGQSIAGALLDHVIQTHPAFPELQRIAAESQIPIYEILAQRIEELAEQRGLSPRESALVAADIHVYPDFAGNRSPLADPHMRGMTMGLTLSRDLSNLAILYLATIQALAYGSRHITEAIVRCRIQQAVQPDPENAETVDAQELQQRRHRFTTLLLCGGLSSNPLYAREHADALQADVVIPEADAMLAGSAVLAAAGLGRYRSVLDAMQGMSRSGVRLSHVLPEASERVLEYHRAKYEVFKQMAELQLSARSTMSRFATRR